MLGGVAVENIKFFMGLNTNDVTNLYVDPVSMQISVDSRVLKSIRRYYDGSSRNDLIEPLQESFSVATNESLYSLDDLTVAVDNIALYLKTLYSETNYNAIFKAVIRKIRLDILDAKTYKRASSALGDTEPALGVSEPVGVLKPVVEIAKNDSHRKCHRRRKH